MSDTGLCILHEDPWLVAVDKPSGLPVHRGWARDRVVLTDLLEERLGKGAVHPLGRLDRGTSGVLLVARNGATVEAFRRTIRAEGALRCYIALVRGVPPESGLVDYPIPNEPGGPRVEARTTFRTLASRPTGPSGESHGSSSPSLAASGRAIATATILLRPSGYEGHVDHRTSNMVQGPRSPFRTVSLVAAFPQTGRLHQIRRHLRHVGHPVIGDSNYGRPDLNRALRTAYGLSRLALHCVSIRLRHPFTHELLQLASPMPENLVVPLQRMGFQCANILDTPLAPETE